MRGWTWGISNWCVNKMDQCLNVKVDTLTCRGRKWQVSNVNSMTVVVTMSWRDGRETEVSSLFGRLTPSRMSMISPADNREPILQCWYFCFTTVGMRVYVNNLTFYIITTRQCCLRYANITNYITEMGVWW